jgi:hypothetical protein
VYTIEYVGLKNPKYRIEKTGEGTASLDESRLKSIRGMIELVELTPRVKSDVG